MKDITPNRKWRYSIINNVTSDRATVIKNINDGHGINNIVQHIPTSYVPLVLGSHEDTVELNVCNLWTTDDDLFDADARTVSEENAYGMAHGILADRARETYLY